MIASSNLFSSTQAVTPVGINTNGHIITVAQFQQKNQKPDWKLSPYRPGKTKKKTKKLNKKEKNKQALLGFS